MNNKHAKTEYSIETEPSTYQTGSTKPPKSYMGVILVLLGLIIFLGGIVTVLGMTNIRLFKALSTQTEAESNAIGFSHTDNPQITSAAKQTGLGFCGETVSEFWHTYHHLPRGVFIQSVETDSDAARQGVLPGDILIRVNGTQITAMEDLPPLQEINHSETVEIVLYRNKGQITLRIHPTE